MISEIEIATSFCGRTRNDRRERAEILRQAQNDREGKVLCNDRREKGQSVKT
jgi:hypothetical protein